jgi:hypothetical protein
MATSTIGIAGHGMLLAPSCPCRVVRIEQMLVIGRGYRGNLITEVIVQLGPSPATEAPHPSGADVSSIGPNARAFSLGPGGPTLILDATDGAPLEDLIVRVDVGLGAAEWSVLAPGFWFDLPPGVILYSPDPQTPGDLPELHYGMNPEAMIGFMRAGRSAEEIVINGPGGTPLASSQLETPFGAVRAFEYKYEHEGAPWVQHKYVLPYAAGKSIVMLAQAPRSLWPELKAAADLIARSFEPIS